MGRVGKAGSRPGMKPGGRDVGPPNWGGIARVPAAPARMAASMEAAMELAVGATPGVKSPSSTSGGSLTANWRSSKTRVSGENRKFLRAPPGRLNSILIFLPPRSVLFIASMASSAWRRS